MKTLAVRMRQHCENARQIAAFLAEHEAVERVYYPGLPDHPGHEIAARQMTDFGGMISFLAASEEAAIRLVGETKVWKLAESLGGVESLIEQPAQMTHASTANAPFAVPPSLVRLSVGIESADDLVADLEQRLRRLSQALPSSSLQFEAMNDWGLYILLLVPTLVIGLAVQWWLRKTFERYSHIELLSGMTGAEVARQILDRNGLEEVPVDRSDEIGSNIHYRSADPGPVELLIACVRTPHPGSVWRWYCRSKAIITSAPRARELAQMEPITRIHTSRSPRASRHRLRVSVSNEFSTLARRPGGFLPTACGAGCLGRDSRRGIFRRLRGRPPRD